MLVTTNAEIDWVDDDEARMCVACYLALRQGAKRHPAEVGFEKVSAVSVSDKQAILGET